MRNDYQDDTSQCGMPVGHPLFRHSRVRYRLDMVHYTVQVEHPEVLAALTPQPLVCADDRLLLSLTSGTELLEGFSEGERPWDEVIMKWRVVYCGEEGHYNFVQYINNSVVAISARELFGQPKIPSRIAIERIGGGFNARLSSWYGEREILALSFAPLPEKPENPARSPFKMPRMINLKQIPSAVPGNGPEVRQLVSMNYGRPVMHGVRPGTGEVVLLTDAPSYLRDAGLGAVTEAFYVDIELDVHGGDILYNYL